MSTYPERGGNWGNEETELLLKLWGQPHIQHEMLVTIRNLEIYNKIAESMHEIRPQCLRTGLQCRYRIKRLKRDYLRAKNEGSPSAFAFYKQMDEIFTERAKVAETQEQTRVEKKLYGKKKLTLSKSATSMIDASQIKIEIDNAEEYEFGVSGHGTGQMGDPAMATSTTSQVDKDKNDSDDDDEDEDIDNSLASDSKDTALEDEDNSLPIRFYETERDTAAHASDPVCSDTECVTSASAADQTADTANIAEKISSSESEHTRPDSSPPPFVIKSVYHVGETEHEKVSHEEMDVSSSDREEDATEPVVPRKSDRGGGEEIVSADADQSDKATEEEEGVLSSSHSGKHTSNDGTVTSEVDKRKRSRKSSKENEAKEDEHVDQDEHLGSPADKVSKQCADTGEKSQCKISGVAEKDLQIIAEWNITDSDTTPSGSTDPNMSSDSLRKGRKLGNKEGDTDPSSVLAENVISSSENPVEKDSLKGSPAYHTVTVKKGSRQGYRLIEAGGIHTLFKIPSSHSGELSGRVPVKMSSVPCSMALKAPVVKVVSTGSSSLVKHGVSLLSSSQASGKSPPQRLHQIIVREPRQPVRIIGSGSQKSLLSPSLITATPSSSRPLIVPVSASDPASRRAYIVSSSPSSSTITSSAAPVKVINASALSPTSSAGSKVIHLKQPTFQKITAESTGLPIVTHSKQPLTFTTISSMDPVPKRMRVSTEPGTRSSQKTTIIIPPKSTLSASTAAPAEVKVVTPNSAAHKDEIEKLEFKADVKHLRQILYEAEGQSGHKRPHEDSDSEKLAESVKAAKTEAEDSPVADVLNRIKMKGTEVEPEDRNGFPCPSKMRGKFQSSIAPRKEMDQLNVSEHADEMCDDSQNSSSPVHDENQETLSNDAINRKTEFVNASSRDITVGQPAVSSSLETATTTTAAEVSSPSAIELPSATTSWTCLSRKEEDDLFRLFLAQTDLSQVCQEWMLQTLKSRTGSAAQPSSEKTEPPPLPSASAAAVQQAQQQKVTARLSVRAELAEVAKGGIIVNVTSAKEAKIAEKAGVCAVVTLEPSPEDQKHQGINRMTDCKKVKEIMGAVGIPVIAKCRIGHFVEAQVWEAMGVHLVDETEVLTAVDEHHHIEKHDFKVPFVCGACDLGEALCRVSEGAAMIRTKGDAETGEVGEAVQHARTIRRQIRMAQTLEKADLRSYAKELQVPFDLLKRTVELGRLPVIFFAAAGVATPADVSLLMNLGVDGVFLGSHIFRNHAAAASVRLMVQAANSFRYPKVVASLCESMPPSASSTPTTNPPTS